MMRSRKTKRGRKAKEEERNDRIENEQELLEDKPKEVKKEKTFRGFAEGRSK